MTLFLIIPASLCFIYTLFKLLHNLLWKPLKTQRFLNSQGIYGPPYRFLLGNVKELMWFRDQALSKPMSSLSHDVSPRILPHMTFWAKKYGRNFVFWIGPRAQLVLGDPELIKQAMSNKDGVLPKAKVPSNFLRMIFGDGVVATEGEKWIKLKKLANFFLHGENLKSMVPGMIASVEMMLERWKDCDGKEIEVHEEFKILSSEVISRTAFGTSFEEGRHIFYMLEKIVKLFETNNFNLKLSILKFVCSTMYKTKDVKEAERMIRGIRESIMQMVKTREGKEKNGEFEALGNDYLGLLIKASREEDRSIKISMEELIDECRILYVTGQETINSLLSWTILLLAIHQEWQEAAREEVINQFGVEKSLDDDGIARLKIVGMIINETLRLYPPVYSGFIRDVHRDVRIGKLIVPAGIQVHIPIMTCHHDPKIWGNDVHLFKPDRFSEGIAKATNNNRMGPHMCAGFNYAMNETKITISMILQRFTFTLSHDYIHSPSHGMILRPEKGIQVILNAL
ncbi:Cytochrome P450 CYP749A22 [Linum perenne]